jgi:hypothetical protein
MVSIKTEKRERDDLWLPLRLFPRCIVTQLQKEQPFIRTKRPQGKLWRPVFLTLEKWFILTFGEQMSLCKNIHVVSLHHKPFQAEKK